MSTPGAATLDSLLDLDSLLSPEERDLRSMVRQFGPQRLRPHIAEWFETGRSPTSRSRCRLPLRGSAPGR